ncbi:hypothetical protein MPTK1_4g02750 [Marchantia polymorpha subsp. ruderalis]|uniref:Domain X domain-containing protein n=2 Tax=Marchantia polymorpha TaxID=3197 RepID=A0AAF6B5M0_MARPO|nr:hypothetical protein MARPO_0080s0024 [Marchantia polymorpha]BBN07304.1 hypothetical protein Mp_4g02750 [Marchantia polymorpha subsp. ruderalis]|eukprot:PTQ34400.1 hypothetical protein MARPO_0080s0024 [Marchantia polymorpha]
MHIHHEFISRYQGIMSGYMNYYSFVDNYGMLKRVAYIVRFSGSTNFETKVQNVVCSKRLQTEWDRQGKRTVGIISLLAFAS